MWEGCVQAYWTRYQGKGDCIYANKGYQIQIIDIADPMKPTKAGAFRTPDDKSDITGQIAAKGDIAVIMSNVKRKPHLFTYDISDERRPKFLAQIECPGSYPYIDGDHAYAITPRGTVMAKIDISDPKQPRLAATFDLKDILGADARLGWGFAVGKGHAFSPSPTAIHKRDFFHVLDVRDQDRIVYAARPHVPEDASPYYWADFWGDAAIAGNTLSLGNYGYVTVLDVADPLHPKLLAKKNFGCQWSTGAIRGGMLYVVNLKGLYAIDIPNSSQVPTGSVTSRVQRKD